MDKPCQANREIGSYPGNRAIYVGIAIESNSALSDTNAGCVIHTIKANNANWCVKRLQKYFYVVSVVCDKVELIELIL